MNTKKELKILKQTEKYLLEPKPFMRKFYIFVTSSIIFAILTGFTVMLLFKLNIISIEGLSIGLVIFGSIFGSMSIYTHLVIRSKYIENHISLSSIQNRINEIET